MRDAPAARIGRSLATYPEIWTGIVDWLASRSLSRAPRARVEGSATVAVPRSAIGGFDKLSQRRVKSLEVV